MTTQNTTSLLLYAPLRFSVRTGRPACKGQCFGGVEASQAAKDANPEDFTRRIS